MSPTRARTRTLRAHTCLAGVSLRRASEHSREWLEKSFRASERRAFSGRTPQSIAGILAAKRAAIDLCADLCGSRTLTERDFIVTHRPSGAPRIAAATKRLGAQCGPLLVSISHTRATAWAAVTRAPARSQTPSGNITITCHR